jgi:hypothetical protein
MEELTCQKILWLTCYRALPGNALFSRLCRFERPCRESTLDHKKADPPRHFVPRAEPGNKSRPVVA